MEESLVLMESFGSFGSFGSFTLVAPAKARVPEPQEEIEQSAVARFPEPQEIEHSTVPVPD
jgi:hypothetical protein